MHELGQLEGLGRKGDLLCVKFRQFQKLLVLPLACVMAMSTSALAQEHVVPRDILAAAVTDHVARQDGDRDAIRTALSHSQVRAMAVKMGLRARANAPVVTRSVDSLSSTPMRQLSRNGGPAWSGSMDGVVAENERGPAANHAAVAQDVEVVVERELP